MKKILLLGNEAIAQGAYEAGCSLAVGYPGTPSSEIISSIATQFKNVHSQWAINEKVALEEGIGASWGGIRVLVTMKHVGINVSADPLFSVAYTGVNGGLVIAIADDPGMWSSQNEQDPRLYAIAAKIPILEPSNSQEAKEYTKEAYRLSEAYDTPVIIRIPTRIAHSRSIVKIGKKGKYIPKKYVKDSSKRGLLPGNARKRHDVLEKKIIELQKYACKSIFNEYVRGGNKIGIITNGSCYNYVKEAFPQSSILKLGMSYPYPDELILSFCKNKKTIIVVEELEPVIETRLAVLGIKSIGKSILPLNGEYSPGLVKTAITNYINTTCKTAKNLEPIQPKEPLFQNLPPRPPVFCPGCPHSNIFTILSRLKINVMGDIGCYTLGMLPPWNAMDSCLCMGASIGNAFGMTIANNDRNTVAVIGDSTFFHSGVTAIIDAVYNKAKFPVIILDNSTTAMTGQQDHPGTGKTAGGEKTEKIQIDKLVKAIGIKHYYEINPYKLEEAETIIRKCLKLDELSVIKTNQPCIILKQRERRKK